MRSKYYKFPLEVNQLFKKAIEKPRLYTSLVKSIDQNLRLIFVSSFGELRFNHEYGSVISELDYSNEQQSGLFEKKIEASLYESIKNYELRLKNVSLKVKYDRKGQIVDEDGIKSYKVYVVIEVDAMINSLNEKFRNTYKIFLSPITDA